MPKKVVKNAKGEVKSVTLSGDDAKKFQEYQEQLKRAEEARKAREEKEARRKKYIALRPKHSADEVKKLLDSASPLSAIQFWNADHGVLKGVVIEVVDVTVKKGERKGEVIRREVDVILDKPVEEPDVENGGTRMVQEAAVMGDEIIKIGPKVKLPAKF